MNGNSNTDAATQTFNLYLGGSGSLDVTNTSNDEHDTTELAATPPEDSNYRISEAATTSCASCSHFTEGTCDLYNALVSGDMTCDSHTSGTGTDPGENLNAVENKNSGLNEMAYSEMYFAGGEVKPDGGSDDGLIWKTVLRTGQWALTPGANQKPIDKPIRVVRENAADGEVALSDLLHAYDNGAFEHVTVPLSHADKVDENTGFVRKLRIVDGENGSSVLKAGFDFTDENIKKKVLDGSIANTSCGLALNRARPSDGQKFKTALYHVALTNRPWIDGMEPFSKGIAASEDIASLQIEEETAEETEVVEASEEVAPEIQTPGVAKITLSYEDVYGPLNDLQRAQARRKTTTDTPRGGELKLSDTATATETTETTTTVELSEEVKAQIQSEREENARLRAEVREMRVDKRIDELKTMGLSEYPGLLVVIRDIMLSDDGGTALLLSEEGSDGQKTESPQTATQIVDRVVAALPKNEEGTKFLLSQQITDPTGQAETTRPASDAKDERTQAQKSRDAAAWLGDPTGMKVFEKGGE